MSQRVDPSEQGRLQGALASLNGISFIIAPLLYPQVFALALDYRQGVESWPVLGAPFFVAAALLTIALAVAARATAPDRRD
jgi:DHA1 family tetracycline resistance protein-like MFS transporter